MQTLRIFISSPGDVNEERDRAKQVVEQLRRRYAGQLDLKAILWEDLPLQADMSFQQGIDYVLSDHGVDIAVFILWSRLGSPTGGLIHREDGSEYRSGTEREFDLMLKARARSGGKRPDLLVYTRADETSFDERLRGKPTREKDEILLQKKLVESFIQEEFHDSEGKTNLRAYHSFDRPVTFSQRLRVHLQELIDPLVDHVAAATVWDVEEQGSPFLGLEAFQPQHAPVFFGREDEILEVRQALKRQACEGRAFVLIAGASGSGKSSLARAGVLPAIVENEIDDTIWHWETLIFTPGELGSSPLEAFAQRLAEVLPALRTEEAAWAADFAKDLREHPAMLCRRVILPALAHAGVTGPASSTASLRLLLLVDQLEELLSGPNWTEADRLAFAVLLEGLAQSGKVWVLATLRADFLGAVQSLPPLVRLRSGGGQVDLLPPEVLALRRLISEPARLAGLRFEKCEDKSLESVILADAAGHPELLPLVGHLLADLHANRTADNVLTFARYQAVGGVSGSLARHADAVFSSLDLHDAARAELGRVLSQLVTVSGDDETVFVRQYPALSCFSPPQLRLVEAFISARLLTTRDDGTVTLAHEVLLRVWLPAQAWVEANADFLRTRAGVEWRRKQGGLLLEGDPLLEGARAQLARESEAFSEEQRDYLTRSLAQAEVGRVRREKVRRRVLVGLSLLTAVSLCGGGIAVWQWQQANQSREHAEEQRQLAEEQRQLAETRRQAEERSRQQAEHARRAADRIIQQTLYDLRDKLQPIGRLDLLDHVSKMAEEYFANQPEDQRTFATERERTTMLNNRGNVLVAQGDSAGALKAYEEGLAISQKLVSVDPANSVWQRDLSISLRNVGKVRWAQGDSAGALKACEESLAISQKLAATDPSNSVWQRDLTISLHGVGHMRLAQGDSAGAQNAYEWGLAICQKLASVDPTNSEWQSNLSISFERVGDMCLAQGYRASAVKAYEESLAIRQKLASADPDNRELQRDLSVAIERVGDVRLAQEDSGGAVKAYEESLAIRQKLASADPSNSGWQRDLSVSLSKVGDVRLAQGESAGALKAYEESLAIDLKLVVADPSNSEWQRSLSVSLEKVGNVRLAQEDSAGALKAYEESLAICQKLASANPSNSEWQRDLSVSLNKVGDVRLAQGDSEGALKAYEESLATSHKLAIADPSNSEWQRDLSVSLERVGNVRLAQGDSAGALKAHEESLAIDHKLASADPSNSAWQRDLSVSLDRVGDVRLAQGDSAGALKAYEESLAIRQKLTSADPSNSVWQRDLSVSFIKVGDVRRAQGESAGALKAYEESLAISQKLALADPSNNEWQTDLVVSLTKLARVYDRMNQKPRAAGFYQQALQIWQALADAGRLTAAQQGWGDWIRNQLQQPKQGHGSAR